MENNKSITLFDYKNIKVRTVIIDGDVWFVAKDICDILEIKNPTDALSNLSEKMKMTLEGKESILGITEDPNTVRILLISEPGMYKLVFRSRKPEAEKFSDWVVSEVLPTIRKTGSYGTTKFLSPMMRLFVSSFYGMVSKRMVKRKMCKIYNGKNGGLCIAIFTKHFSKCYGI